MRLKFRRLWYVNLFVQISGIDMPSKEGLSTLEAELLAATKDILARHDSIFNFKPICESDVSVEVEDVAGTFSESTGGAE